MQHEGVHARQFRVCVGWRDVAWRDAVDGRVAREVNNA